MEVIDVIYDFEGGPPEDHSCKILLSDFRRRFFYDFFLKSAQFAYFHK